jgi:hypothetical protein
MKIFLNILSGAGILIWVFAFFIGFNYVQNGALIVSVPIALILGIVMGVLIWGLKRYSNPPSGTHVGRAKIAEYILFGVYVLVVLVSAIFINHTVVVTTKYQKQIQQMAQNQIGELERIFGTAETAGSYLSYVANKINVYGIELEGKKIDAGTIETRQSVLENALCSEFNNLKTEAEASLNDYKPSIMDWNWFTVGNNLKLLQDNKSKWEKEIVGFSTKVDYTKDEPYDCGTTNDAPVKDLSDIDSADIAIGAIALMLILQMVILSTYLMGRPRKTHIGAGEKEYVYNN